ncbi:MAG: hypothetical protein P8Z79_12160 [Sedimentisphaerales bacterium]|jgi:hypothetical protein
MLRVLSFFFFGLAGLEIILIPIGKLEPVVGFFAAVIAVFFAGVLRGMSTIAEELQALRSQIGSSGIKTLEQNGG